MGALEELQHRTVFESYEFVDKLTPFPSGEVGLWSRSTGSTLRPIPT